MILLKRFFYVFLIVVACVVVSSCTKTQIDFGGEFLDNGNTNIVYVDTFVPAWSTIYRDSFPTSGTGSLLVGRYTDPYFGVVSASTAFHIQPPALIDIANTANFDSLTLELHPDKSFYGDTTKPIRLNVYQLAQRLFYLEGTTAMYNNRSVDFNPTAIGSASVLIWPKITDSVQVRLNDALGLDLFTKFRDKADEMKNEDDFINYFKGILISADASSNNAIFGFADGTAELKLYYHESNLFNEEKKLEFFITQSQFQFNQVRTDRTGTPLQSLTAVKPELPSDASNGAAYLQPATGLFTKVMFPTIRNLLQRTDYSRLMKAELIIKPVQASYTPNFALPAQVNLYATDESNAQGTAISPETGNLVTDYLQRENTFYSFDVTAYLTGQLTVATANRNGLLLNIPTGTKLFNRAVIKDGSAAADKSFIKLYYLSIKNTNP